MWLARLRASVLRKKLCVLKIFTPGICSPLITQERKNYGLSLLIKKMRYATAKKDIQNYDTLFRVTG